MMSTIIFNNFYIFLLLFVQRTTSDPPDKGISRQQLENWASKFGGPLSEFARSVTKYNELHGRFQQSINSNVSSLSQNLDALLREISDNIKDNFKERVQALQKLQTWAEERALEYNERGGRGEPKPSNYFSSKRINREMDEDDKWNYPTVLPLRMDHHFGTEVNFTTSTVHIPTSIYEKERKILEGLEWSSDMDESFIHNLHQHPILHWQYFGSSTGFLRQYPGMSWPKDNKGAEPDLFDSRMRPWYTSAANSPKNIVILQDTSGSMTGRRREIAKHVVYTILDTLTENDYVNVFNFSGNATPVVPCFHDRLVQANLENIREFKVALDQDATQGMADLESAITTAFQLLNSKVNESDSSGCNQAIMLITDGSPYYYEEVFRVHQNPMHPVRIFTYLIGKEVTDFREVRWMACTNQGYFVHVSTLGEVQEQVLKYLPVMSRPMVINGKHDITWSPIYANLVVPPHRGSPSEHNYEFVISISMPVFDLRNKTTPGELKSLLPTSLPELEGNSSKVKVFRQERIANFLGVVGTDIPRRELRRLTTPFKLGVNGYAFIVNNNGHVVLHPHWRPVYRDILKPNYNTVDFTEVELVDNNGGTFRNNDSDLLMIRKDLVHQVRNFAPLRVRVPQDEFKRVTIRHQRYEYKGIPDTPYSLGLSIPENMNRFHGQMELSRVGKDDRTDITHYLDSPSESGPRRWSLNPNWSYCTYFRSDKTFESPEDLLLHFLREIQMSTRTWKWKNTGVGLIKGLRHPNKRHSQEDIYECDRELVQSLIFDANVTDVFTSNKLWKFNKNESQIISMYGALMTFIATRSGLTRWVEFNNRPKDDDNGGSGIDPYATESLWYQRAVDRYEFDPNSFVYSVPFDAGRRNDSRVTATRAVYVTKHGKRAPVAVVGLQFDHKKWAERFYDISSSCIQGMSCKKTCSSEEFNCFVLDDNGFILYTEKHIDTGKFFGEVDGMVMEMLVNSDVYKRVRVYDYQAVCLQPFTKSSPASILINPISHIKWILSWMFTQFLYLALNFNYILAQLIEDLDMSSPIQDYININKTKLSPCDHEYDLYTYGPSYNSHNFSYHGILNKCGHNCDGYFNVHYIPHTNLILVVTDGKCSCGHNTSSIEGREVDYDVVNGTDKLCKIPTPSLERQRPTPCYNFNPEEKELLEECGSGSLLKISFFTFHLTLFVNIFYHMSNLRLVVL